MLRAVGILALATTLLGTALLAGARVLGRAPEREPAPALTLELADGRRLALAELAGRQVVLEFFAVWCPECRRDVARLERLAASACPRVTVLAVALEGDPGHVQAEVRAAGGTYTVGVADAGCRARFGIARFPTRFLVDAEGRLAARDVEFARILAAVDP